MTNAKTWLYTKNFFFSKQCIFYCTSLSHDLINTQLYRFQSSECTVFIFQDWYLYDGNVKLLKRRIVPNITYHSWFCSCYWNLHLTALFLWLVATSYNRRASKLTVGRLAECSSACWECSKCERTPTSNSVERHGMHPPVRFSYCSCSLNPYVHEPKGESHTQHVTTHFRKQDC